MIEGKLMIERALPGDLSRPGAKGRGGWVGTTRAQPARSVSVNLAESPLGWLYARGHVSERQYRASERLRWDWERAQLDPQVTMRWDAAPIRRGRGGAGPRSTRRPRRWMPANALPPQLRASAPG